MLKAIEEYGDFFIYPALLAYLLYADAARLVSSPFTWAAMFALGWAVWTFAEYVAHRWVLHGMYWMGIHELHHKRPRELSRFPVWQIPSYFLAIFVAVWLVSGQWTTAVYAGIILGWIMFFVMHYLLHQYPALFPAFTIRHNAHHKLTTMNYGITVDWWDRVFGTFRAAPERPSAGTMCR